MLEFKLNIHQQLQQLGILIELGTQEMCIE